MVNYGAPGTDATAKERIKSTIMGAPGAAQRSATPYAKRAFNISGKLETSKPFQQTVNILTGKIYPSQIVKYLFILAIILIAIMFAIGFVRGLIVGVQQIACGVTHVVSGGEYCIPQNMKDFYFMWDMEWIIRCLIYMCFALIVLTILYVWATWLFDKLLRFDLYVKKFDNWIYGFEWEGKAEK